MPSRKDRQSLPPRPPEILRKGGSHKDRRREAEDDWLQRQLDEVHRSIENMPPWKRASLRREVGN